MAQPAPVKTALKHLRSPSSPLIEIHSDVEVDLTVLFDAGRLLYGGAFVAERYDAFGEFLETHEDGADPTVFGKPKYATWTGAGLYANTSRRCPSVYPFRSTKMSMLILRI